jgi:hypothetical protein
MHDVNDPARDLLQPGEPGESSRHNGFAYVTALRRPGGTKPPALAGMPITSSTQARTPNDGDMA